MSKRIFHVAPSPFTGNDLVFSTGYSTDTYFYISIFAHIYTGNTTVRVSVDNAITYLILGT